MACNSDYLAPSDHEKRLQRAAQLFVYVATQIGATPHSLGRAILESKNIYAQEDFAADLCGLLNALTSAERDALVYNARDGEARKLADWWEEHQEKDAAHKRREQEDLERLRLRKQALKKLTSEELKALGLKA